MAPSNAKPRLANGSLPPVQEPPRRRHFGVLSVLILYEDFEAGVAARQSLENVLAQLRLDADSDVTVTLWRLDLLNERALSAQAVEAAAGADIVLLSLHGDRPLPAAAKEWLLAWLGRRGDRGTALGVLLNGERRHASTGRKTLTYLQRVTRRRPVDLVAGYFRAPTRSADSFLDGFTNAPDTRGGFRRLGRSDYAGPARAERAVSGS